MAEKQHIFSLSFEASEAYKKISVVKNFSSVKQKSPFISREGALR